MSIQQQQFLNLFVLLILGAFVSHFYLSWYQVIAIFLFTYFADIGFNTRLKCMETEKKHFFHPTVSSFSTAIGVMMMMAASQFYIYFIVIALALLQKYHLKVAEQHFFNPSNFALIMALLFFYEDAHIVVGQLGDELWISMLLVVLALSILVRANRWMISVSFVGFYLLLEYFFVVKADPVLIMEEVYYRFYSVSFILFILFMLTDPRTTPQKGYQQVVFALLITLFTVGLDYFYGFRVQHLFLALFLFSLWVPLVRLWGQANKTELWMKTAILFILAVVVIISIESRAPFYFSMDI